jgi:hypothetical protein
MADYFLFFCFFVLLDVAEVGEKTRFAPGFLRG